MKIQEINVNSGEEIVRDFTADEIDQFNLDQEAEASAVAAAQAATESAEAKLAALGLTADDLKALGL